MKRWSFLALAAAIAALPLASCGAPGSGDTAEGGGEEVAGGAGRLQTVLDRGELVCGVDGGIPGFSFVDDSGAYSGLDVDTCRAVAAALFDDPDALEFRRLDSTERFEALKGGEVDMLARNTTWTISRDTSVGMEFAPTTFYDGQGMMVKEGSGITSLEDFEGKSACVETGTTTELNLTDQMRQRGVNFEPVVFQDADAAYAAYDEGRCDGMTSDKSQLIARRTTLTNPDENVLLDVTMSKEPLGPVTTNNDSAWFDTVKWVTFALFQAEELGLTSENIEQEAESTEDPNILRFVGAEGTLGSDMGLPNDFAERAIRHVGNYGEIYERNLGPETEFDLPRGQNTLWTEGGLQYSPPFR
ncbi:amino acid ABC transporter substrate-binding protein [Romeria aff. gracilis LEGE 07310]|uniref:Amino acid ABC transporter substrate-binding protein n=1 Tax=Vasconcelosia minhoensis LEGE 07310 TaxID=915328 RepID=A0A8J7DP03_9CYAN|nr:amino acid ABC transporter substrate-binding protein [Romeria gracilis]MBE9078875.1 amino acid ABC transporter substrate-binding protein [Romeria aff. gracilis LEGE 07310]